MVTSARRRIVLLLLLQIIMSFRSVLNCVAVSECRVIV